MTKQTLCLSGVHHRQSDPILLLLQDEENGKTFQVPITDFLTTPWVDQLKAQDAFTIGYLSCHDAMTNETAEE